MRVHVGRSLDLELLDGIRGLEVGYSIELKMQYSVPRAAGHFLYAISLVERLLSQLSSYRDIEI